MIVEQVADTGWFRSVHPFLRDLLTGRAPNARAVRLGYVTPRPNQLRGVAIVRPRRPIYGQSTAPQTGGGGLVHLLRDMAVGTWTLDRRVALARWACGGRTTYPRCSDEPLPGDACTSCIRAARPERTWD